MVEEILNHIKALKNHKKLGEDGITGELLKIGPANLSKYIYRLVSLICHKEEIPKEWKMEDSNNLYSLQERRQTNMQQLQRDCSA